MIDGMIATLLTLIFSVICIGVILAIATVGESDYRNELYRQQLRKDKTKWLHTQQQLSTFQLKDAKLIGMEKILLDYGQLIIVI